MVPGIERLWATLDTRFALMAVAGTLASVLILGIPTAVIPNPFFVRMTPTDAVNGVVLLVSAPLMGLLIATYAGPRVRTAIDPHASTGTVRTTLGSVAAYLAIGCPICNKIIVAVLGVSGALDIFAPLQPVIGLISVVLLGTTLVWRLRARARGCPRCVSAPGDQRHADLRVRGA